MISALKESSPTSTGTNAVWWVWEGRGTWELILSPDIFSLSKCCYSFLLFLHVPRNSHLRRVVSFLDMNKFFLQDIQWYLVYLVSLGRQIPKGFANVIWIALMDKSSKQFDVVITHVCVIPNTVSQIPTSSCSFESRHYFPVYFSNLQLYGMLLGRKMRKGE